MLSLVCLGAFSLSAGLVCLMRAWAVRRALLDLPNYRSSHRVAVPRLGGAAFIPVVLIGLLSLHPEGSASVVFGAALFGAAALYSVSLWDDLSSLPTGVRFGIQFAVALLVLRVALVPLQALAATPAEGVVGFLNPGVGGYWLLLLWFVGLINVYNFMDGIDGIAGLQAVVAGVAWAIVGTVLSLSGVQLMGAVISSAAFGFLTLNWPPAKIFMGDAGSMVLGFLFATLPLLATAESGGRLDLVLSLAIGSILVWPFLADGIFTFLRRLKNRENVLQAHRSHLYQRLVIAGHSHPRVTVTYGCLALLGAALVIPLLKTPAAGVGGSTVLVVLVVLGGAFLWLWWWTRASENRAQLTARSD